MRNRLGYWLLMATTLFLLYLFYTFFIPRKQNVGIRHWLNRLRFLIEMLSNHVLGHFVEKQDIAHLLETPALLVS